MTHTRITIFVGSFVATMALFLASHNPALAYFVSGNELYAECKSEKTASQTNCLGFISAVVDAIEVGFSLEQGPKACVPENLNREQVKDIILSWIEQNPKGRHNPAILISYVALVDAFICDE